LRERKILVRWFMIADEGFIRITIGNGRRDERVVQAGARFCS